MESGLLWGEFCHKELGAFEIAYPRCGRSLVKRRLSGHRKVSWVINHGSKCPRRIGSVPLADFSLVTAYFAPGFQGGGISTSCDGDREPSGFDLSGGLTSASRNSLNAKFQEPFAVPKRR
jgi:hypothetical protein